MVLRSRVPGACTPAERSACRYDRTWGHLFEDFGEFVTYSWPTVVVTDAQTGKAHIVTRASTIAAFVKMVKTRYVCALFLRGGPLTGRRAVAGSATRSRR
jgi:hypothetical protein